MCKLCVLARDVVLLLQPARRAVKSVVFLQYRRFLQCECATILQVFANIHKTSPLKDVPFNQLGGNALASELLDELLIVDLTISPGVDVPRGHLLFLHIQVPVRSYEAKQKDTKKR